MANTVNGLLTSYASVVEVELNYFFVITSSGFVPNTESTSYFFIGKPDAWDDDVNPPIPNQSQSYIKQTFNNMFAAKLITTNNMCPVIPRIDWTSDIVYSQYTDYDNMFTYDYNGIISKNFYVRNSYDQIFKCLFNNNESPSTVEPILQAGATDASQTLYLSDGYKWIYITTIDKGLKKNFFDANWMPLQIGNITPNTLLPAGFGSINAINVTNSGNGYSNGISTTVITIKGDGQGATAYANVYNNIVKDVIVTNTGNNYTYSTVSITPQLGYSGNSATANAIVSPIGGHASDPVSELGCNHIMLSIELDGTENGNISTNTSFRQIGILVNPSLNDGTVPSETSYNISDTAIVSIGLGGYQVGEIVYQGSSLDASTFSAKVASFDSANSTVSLINTNGSYVLNNTLIGSQSKTFRVLLNYFPTNFNVGSGYMMYFENRTPVQRSANSNEQFRLALRF
jgi:hypothetical protein